jgi:peptide/nickel transport system permease protein
VKWLGKTVRGDLGRSYLPGGEKVRPAIASRLPLTLELLILAELIALAVAIPAGIFSAYRAGGAFDRSATTAAFGLLSIPSFMMGILLIFAFAVRLRWFRATGYVPLGDGLTENLKSLFLPALTLAVAEMAVYMRLLRTDMVATLQEDFIQMAKAKGLPTRRILLRHAFRPSTFSLITIAGLNFGALVGGALVVERLFALNGIGLLVVTAIAKRDYIMVQGCVLVVAIGYVVINFFVDMLYAVLDPRIRHARATA